MQVESLFNRDRAMRAYVRECVHEMPKAESGDIALTDVEPDPIIRAIRVRERLFLLVHDEATPNA